jgi:hypothetical protein
MPLPPGRHGSPSIRDHSTVEVIQRGGKNGQWYLICPAPLAQAAEIEFFCPLTPDFQLLIPACILLLHPRFFLAPASYNCGF